MYLALLVGWRARRSRDTFAFVGGIDIASSETKPTLSCVERCGGIVDIAYRIAMIVVPLVPIFLLSRLLILFCRQFAQPVQSILIGNFIALVVMVVLGAIALSIDGRPDFARSISLFFVYVVVVLIDLARFWLRTMKAEEVELMLPGHGRQRHAPTARGRPKLRP